MTPERKALLIIDHGTRRAEANARLGEFARAVAQRRSQWLVAHAHMELGQPDVASAIDRLVEAGAGSIHVHPHFLSAGTHVRETIPGLIDAAREKHASVEITIGDPLGHDERLVDLVVDVLDGRSGTD